MKKSYKKKNNLVSKKKRTSVNNRRKSIKKRKRFTKKFSKIGGLRHGARLCYPIPEVFQEFINWLPKGIKYGFEIYKGRDPEPGNDGAEVVRCAFYLWLPGPDQMPQSHIYIDLLPDDRVKFISRSATRNGGNGAYFNKEIKQNVSKKDLIEYINKFKKAIYD